MNNNNNNIDKVDIAVELFNRDMNNAYKLSNIISTLENGMLTPQDAINVLEYKLLSQVSDNAITAKIHELIADCKKELAQAEENAPYNSQEYADMIPIIHRDYSVPSVYTYLVARNLYISHNISTDYLDTVTDIYLNY